MERHPLDKLLEDLLTNATTRQAFPNVTPITREEHNKRLKEAISELADTLKIFDNNLKEKGFGYSMRKQLLLAFFNKFIGG